MGACSSVLKQILIEATSPPPPKQESKLSSQQVSKPPSQQEWKPSSQQEWKPSSQQASGDDAVYQSLPPNAEKVAVRNVYDGDTLTLLNEDRVRFVGIDTPELKEKEPFAVEAKEYSKSWCKKSDVYLVNGEKDKFGRILAVVYVQLDDGRFLCLNEGLVASGLAVVYSPSTSDRCYNWDKLVALQKRAREKGCGRWSQFQDRVVVKTANGNAFHKRSCEHLSNVKHLTEMKESEAMDIGLHPCRTCMSLG